MKKVEHVKYNLFMQFSYTGIAYQTYVIWLF